MSRFFQGSDSDTDSSSSSEGELYSDHEDEEQSDGGLDMEGDDEDESEAEEGSGEEDQGAARRFLRGAVSDESDEEEGKRIVKSAKDKRLQEIEATSKLIENGGKINDWVVISNGISSLRSLC